MLSELISSKIPSKTNLLNNVLANRAELKNLFNEDALYQILYEYYCSNLEVFLAQNLDKLRITIVNSEFTENIKFNYAVIQRTGTLHIGYIDNGTSRGIFIESDYLPVKFFTNMNGHLYYPYDFSIKSLKDLLLHIGCKQIDSSGLIIAESKSKITIGLKMDYYIAEIIGGFISTRQRRKTYTAFRKAAMIKTQQARQCKYGFEYVPISCTNVYINKQVVRKFDQTELDVNTRIRSYIEYTSQDALVSKTCRSLFKEYMRQISDSKLTYAIDLKIRYSMAHVHACMKVGKFLVIRRIISSDVIDGNNFINGNNFIKKHKKTINNVEIDTEVDEIKA